MSIKRVTYNITSDRVEWMQRIHRLTLTNMLRIHTRPPKWGPCHLLIGKYNKMIFQCYVEHQRLNLLVIEANQLLHLPWNSKLHRHARIKPLTSTACHESTLYSRYSKHVTFNFSFLFSFFSFLNKQTLQLR